MRLSPWILGFFTSLAAHAQDLDTEVKDMTWVGFRYDKGASRVFVKTTEPVKFAVDKSRADVVVLTLDNTRVPWVNNTRPLETQYFVSPITRVDIKPIEGPSPSVRIEIHVRRKADLKESQKDTLLALDFS